MSITLAHAGTTLQLSSHLHWQDEYTWQSVAQSLRYGVTGKLLVESQVKQYGRPITLVGATYQGWLQRDTLDTLRVWADVAGRVMTLHLRDVDRSVSFNHALSPIESEPLFFELDPEPSDLYIVTLRFLTVPPPA